MLNPKITVYITAYNYGKYVERSIDSVINQSIDSWELIVINDGQPTIPSKSLKSIEHIPKSKLSTKKIKD